MLLLALLRPAHADDMEEFRKALQELSVSLEETTKAAAELSQAAAELDAVTAEARAHALEWVLAYRNGPHWPAQMERAASGPVADGIMVIGEYIAGCQDTTSAPEDRYGLCVKMWKGLTDADIQDFRLHATLAAAADDAHHPDVAFVAGHMAVELNQKDAKMAYLQALYAIKANQLEDAASVTALAMSLEMREEVVAETALVLAKLGALPIAIQLLEQALAARPVSGVLLSREGLLLAGGGRPDLATEVLNRADATGYAGADLQLAWGHTLMTLDKPAEALVRYRKAVALDPTLRSEVPPALQAQLGP